MTPEFAKLPAVLLRNDEVAELAAQYVNVGTESRAHDDGSAANVVRLLRHIKALTQLRVVELETRNKAATTTATLSRTDFQAMLDATLQKVIDRWYTPEEQARARSAAEDAAGTSSTSAGLPALRPGERDVWASAFERSIHDGMAAQHAAVNARKTVEQMRAAAGKNLDEATRSMLYDMLYGDLVVHDAGTSTVRVTLPHHPEQVDLHPDAARTIDEHNAAVRARVEPGHPTRCYRCGGALLESVRKSGRAVCARCSIALASTPPARPASPELPPIEARVQALEATHAHERISALEDGFGVAARKVTTYEASIVAAEKRLLALEDDMRGVLLGRQELPIDERVDALEKGAAERASRADYASLMTRIEDLNRRVADHERRIPALCNSLAACARADYAGLAKRFDDIERRVKELETEPCPNCNGTT